MRRKKAASGSTREGDPAAEQVTFEQSSLHELFDRQIREMLDRTDLGEEQKQAILIGMSLSVLRRRRHVVHREAQALKFIRRRFA